MTQTVPASAYQGFLNTLSQKQWRRIGVRRRSGAAVPLFSLYSKDSIGIGEIPDIKLLIDWCVKSGISIVQLLPLNDVGFNFAPYDAQSSFAQEPMYLSLKKLTGVSPAPFTKKISRLRKTFPAGMPRVNYGIKKAKLELLREMFQAARGKFPAAFKTYCRKNKHWLEDYSLFKVFKSAYAESSWETWPEEAKTRNPRYLSEVKKKNDKDLLFYAWLQWQLFEQFSRIRRYARQKKVLLMGDLPFLVSRDSADVWAQQSHFKLNLAAGAPPDLYFATGQRWGMPPYEWNAIEQASYDYVIRKLKYAENFYDLYRIDHVVGMFRLWSIPLSEPLENGGLNGFFDPAEESLWEDHGRKILSVMIQNTKMLACAEDLGVVPDCSYRVLEDFGIPGMEVVRWTKDWRTTYDFKEPKDYRQHSVAVTSTHDMAAVPVWWQDEAGTVDLIRFRRECEIRKLEFEKLKPELFDLERSAPGRLRWKAGINSVEALLEKLQISRDEAFGIVDLYLGSFDEKEKFLYFLERPDFDKSRLGKEFMESVLSKSIASASIFNIPLLQDWLALDFKMLSRMSGRNFRINVPGTIGEHNWSLVLPASLEAILKLSVNSKIRSLNLSGQRI